ncbi:hypothetical protein M3Y99_01917900 [Aphelenchoides fujianensis]|nr:hypothetical protein M3Y99_01917900 [Aphelenchoides fujianensis]
MSSSSSSRRRRSRSRSTRSRSRERSRDYDRRDRDRGSRDRDRDRDRYSRRRSPSPRRRRSRSRSRDYERRRRRSRSPRPWRGGGGERRGGRLPGPERRDVMPFTARRSPPPNAKVDMTPEERDDRTIFILQLARDTRPADLEEFFSSVGHVRDVRIITDSKTRRSKGIAYVEFWEREAVPLGLALNGQKLRNAPLVIQQTCAERNRLAAATVGSSIGFGPAAVGGPIKLWVNNLHPSISDDMLAEIFEPFGRIDRCHVDEQEDGQQSNRGYVVFKSADDGKKALSQLNGFDLAGRKLAVTTADDEPQQRAPSDRLDDRNINGGAGRLQLMAKLAEGSDVDVPQVTRDAIASQQTGAPEFATQFILLSNMFDPRQETDPGWDLDVRDDIILECEANGGVVHVYVDKTSEEGHVYLKCPTILAAYKAVLALHGRVFAGKVIAANFITAASYFQMFPEAQYANELLQPRPQ